MSDSGRPPEELVAGDVSSDRRRPVLDPVLRASLALASWALRRSPLRRGRMRVARRLAPIALRLDPAKAVRTERGGQVWADLRTGMCTDVYFLGLYEPSITNLVEAVVEPGDVCVDAGAAFGWYTVLCSSLVGPKGTVISFEPNPVAAELLARTLALGDESNVDVRTDALSHRRGHTRVVLDDDAPTLGHASIEPVSIVHDPRGAVADDDIEVTTIDEAISEPVAFMKVDVEGSELALLAGASRVLENDRPWLVVEMAVATCRRFGHHPNAILDLLAKHGYRFLAIDEPRDRVIPLDVFPDGHPGANVLCVPAGADLPESVVRRIAPGATIHDIVW